MDEEQSVLRWGGLAGIVGGILLVAVFVIVGVFVGPDPTEPEGLVMRFPDVRAAHVVEEVLYLGVLALGVAMLGAPAFGQGFGWMSLVVGVLGVAAGVVLLIDPGSPIAIVSILSLIVFHIALGWKVYTLSRVPNLSRIRRRS